MSARFNILEPLRISLLSIAGLAMVVVVGVADHISGSYLDFYLFYLIPVSFAAWFCGSVPGFIVSVASAASWFIADDLGDPGRLTSFAIFWNSVIRVSIFAIFSHTLCWIRSYQHKRKEFIEFMVHDMRTPLAVVSLGLSQLNKYVSDGAMGDQHDLLKACRSSVVRISTLVNAFLDAARIENNMLTPVVTPWTVTKLLDQVFGETSILAARQGVKLERKVTLTDETVYSDQDILTRILSNLVGNALKVSEPGTTVTICVEKAAQDKLRFKVIDQGPGIPKNIMYKIFGKFVQTGRHDKALSAGSGLGLNYCKMAVRQLKGQIFIDSEVGRGTEISFVVPSVKPGKL